MSTPIHTASGILATKAGWLTALFSVSEVKPLAENYLAVVEAGRLLAERVAEFEGSLDGASDPARDFYGHVSPALSRFNAALQAAEGEGE